MRFLRLVATTSLLLAFVVFLSSCAYKGPSEKPEITLHVACLGDSITYGYKLADPARQSYPSHLTQQSRRRWQVINAGVNGATVINKGNIPITAQKVYQDIIQSNPDIVVIMLGTNDTKDSNWHFINDFVNDYVKMITKIQQLSSKPHVIVCSIPPIFVDYPGGINSEREKEINVLVKKAAEIAGADFFDINKFLLKKPDLFIDGIHPNTKGTKEIAALTFKKLSSI